MINLIKRKIQIKKGDETFRKMLDNPSPSLKPLNTVPLPPHISKPAPFENRSIPKHEVQGIVKPLPKVPPAVPNSTQDVHEGLPEFKDVKVSPVEKNIPRPPDYFSKIKNVRQDVMKGGIDSVPTRVIRKPIFVEVMDYKKLLGEIDRIKKDSVKSKKLGIELNEIKIKKEKRLENWDMELEKMQKNLMLIDTILFEGE